MYMSTSWDTVYAIPCQSCPSRKIIIIGYTELVSKKHISFKESGSPSANENMRTSDRCWTMKIVTCWLQTELCYAVVLPNSWLTEGNWETWKEKKIIKFRKNRYDIWTFRVLFQRNTIQVPCAIIEYWNQILCFHGRPSFSKQKTAVNDNCAIPESCPSKNGPSAASQLAWCFWSSTTSPETGCRIIASLGTWNTNYYEYQYGNWYTGYTKGKIYK